MAIAWLLLVGLAAPSLAAPPAEDAFPITLGSFSATLIGSVPARTANIRHSVAALDGVVLRPGERLSFNQVVGERSATRGYQRAPVILREARQMQLGGGICQTASTLFATSRRCSRFPRRRNASARLRRRSAAWPRRSTRRASA